MKKYKKINSIGNFGIDKYGEIINFKTNGILKPVLDKDGYKNINTSYCGQSVRFRVHREVAKAYILNPDNKPVTNHKDGNKTNNYVDNLEWSTVRENTIHAYELGLSSLPVRAVLKDIKNNTTKEFRSVQYLSRSINIDQKNLLGFIKHSKKYPVLNRYIITILDENSLVTNLNSSNFGKPVYVFDYLTSKKTVYPSIGTATYFTGLRSILKLHPMFLNKLGFKISLKDFETPNVTKNNIRNIKEFREKYYSKPYKPILKKYALRNILSKENEVLYFNNRDGLNNFLVKTHNKKLTVPSIPSIRIKSKQSTRLIFGYSLQMYNTKEDLIEWDKHSIEEAYNSRHGLFHKTPLYEISLPNNEIKLISTDVKLIDFLENYVEDKSILSNKLSNVNLTIINKQLDNITIRRLNKIKI